MTAGRGVVHSEMPVPEAGALLHGFQLWVNLPKKDKMCKPRYQDYPPEGARGGGGGGGGGGGLWGGAGCGAAALGG